jgi:hypothetical protein
MILLLDSYLPRQIAAAWHDHGAALLHTAVAPLQIGSRRSGVARLAGRRAMKWSTGRIALRPALAAVTSSAGHRVGLAA